MRDLNANYWTFLSCLSIASLAAVCIRFGVAWYALELTGSAALFAGIIGLSTAFEVLGKPLLAPLGDAFDRLTVFRTSVALCAFAGLLLAMAALWLPFSAALLTVALVFLGVVSGLADTTAAALVPTLVEPAHLSQAQAARSAASSGVTIAGPIIAAGVIAIGGAKPTLVVAVGLLGVAFACALLTKGAVANAGVIPPTVAAFVRSWHTRIINGLRSIWRNDAERKMSLSTAIINAGVFPFAAVVLPVWTQHNFGGNALYMAACEASLGVGVLVGSISLVDVVNSRLGRYRSVLLGTLVTGVGLVMASLLSSLIPIMASLFFSGMGVAVYFINTTTLRSIATPAAFRSRSTAGAGLLSQCIHPFALGGYGIAIVAFGVTTAGVICGLVVLTSLLLMLRNRDARSLLEQPNAEIVGAYERMYPNAFAENLNAK